MTIQIERLVRRFGDKTALDLGRFEIGRGETFGLLGSNGAGKTTFLRLLLDLLEPSEGGVVIDGVRVSESEAWKPSTGSYLDESFLLDYLTADEYFRFVADVYGMTETMLLTELALYQPFYPDEPFGATTKLVRDLSRGNAKKIGIIAAMIPRPQLLVLDEPFANLDPGSQIMLKQMLKRINRELGTTVLVSSHDLLHVTDVCRRITVLEEGRVVRDIETSPATLRDLEQYFSPRDQGGVPSSTRR